MSLKHKIFSLLTTSYIGSPSEQKNAQRELDLISHDFKEVFCILSELIANIDTQQLLRSSAAFFLRQMLRKAIETNNIDSEDRQILFKAISDALSGPNLDRITKNALNYCLNLLLTGEWFESLTKIDSEIIKKKNGTLNFSVNLVSKIMKKCKITKRIGSGAPVYLAAVLEFLASEMLELAGNAAKDYKTARIVPKHIQLATRKNKELNKLIIDRSINQNVKALLENKKKK